MFGETLSDRPMSSTLEMFQTHNGVVISIELYIAQSDNIILYME